MLKIVKWKKEKRYMMQKGLLHGGFDAFFFKWQTVFIDIAPKNAWMNQKKAYSIFSDLTWTFDW